MSAEAVIVSTARTPLAKSFRGAFNMSHGAHLGGVAVRAAMERAGVEPGDWKWPWLAAIIHRSLSPGDQVLSPGIEDGR